MDELIIEQLRGIVGADNVLLDEPMSAHTTFRIGGQADCLVIPSTPDEVKEVVDCCNAAGIEWRVLGHGSNLLVSDDGVRGVVIQISGNLAGIEVLPEGRLRVQAGVSNAKVAAVACREGLAGYEFAAGIPGTVGGAAIMNAGAYDGEFRNVAVSVCCLTPEGEFVDVPAEQAGWSYRHSMMGDKGFVVLSALLQLSPGDPAEIRARMDDLAQRRSSKQPLELPSAGSTFKRPEGYFAAKLIDDAGLRGFRCGGAQVSEKHTGFVVNIDNATAADVLAVIEGVKASVKEHAGVVLEPEVRMWGFEDNSN